MTHVHPFVVVSTPGMHELAARTVALLASNHGMQLPHHQIEFERFANGEVLPHVPVTVRRQHVFVFHAMQLPSPNDAVITALLVHDALKRASVSGITLVAPYLPYLRQDRKHKPRVPISARMLADIIESNHCVERVITADMHADQEQGFFSIPVDNLMGMGLFAEHFKKMLGSELANSVVVAPERTSRASFLVSPSGPSSSTTWRPGWSGCFRSGVALGRRSPSIVT